MIVRTRSVITVFLLIVALIASTYLISCCILLRGFTRVEERLVERNMQRAQEIISAHVQDLDSKLMDWAIWDDSYKFIQDGNQEFIKSNLDKSAPINLKINFILFFDQSAHLVYSCGVDLKNGVSMPVPASLLAAVNNTRKLTLHEDVKSSVSGIFIVPEGPLFVASRPIVTSKQAGPIRGTLIFARYLDDSEIRTLSSMVKFPLTISLLGSPAPDGVARPVQQELLRTKKPSLTRLIDRQNIAGYTLLPDIFGNPAVLLKIVMPREIFVLGRQTMGSFFWALVLVGIVFGFAVYLPLEYGVVRREQSESRMKKLLATTRSILESMPFGVVIIGKDKKIRYANKATVRMMGAESPEQLIGQVCHSFICPAEKGQCPVLELGQAVDTSERTLIDLKGQRIPVIKSVLPVSMEGEEALLESFVDISERKKAEAEVARLYAMTRSILEKSPFGVYVVNDRGCIEYVNPAMTHISGESQEQFSSIRFFDQDTPHGKVLAGKIKSVLQGQTFFMHAFKFTSLYSHKTTIRNMSGMPFQEAGMTKALIFVEDITERDNLERMKSALTHMIVHDLNNPLAGIIGTVDLLQREMQGVLLSAQEVSFNLVLQSGRDMRNMISDLLDVNKMEEGKFNLRYEDVDLNVLLAEVRDSMNILAQGETKAISIDACEGLVVWADRTILQRIISNLIGNALKFTSSGSTITVRARYDDGAKAFVISVQDHGVGIPKGYVSRVFEKFIQVEAAQMKGRTGKGLGLTFCKMAVEAHGGMIWAESVVDKGSVFYFTIPVKPGLVNPQIVLNT